MRTAKKRKKETKERENSWRLWDRKGESDTKKTHWERGKNGVDRKKKRESERADKSFGVWACAVVGCGLERGETLGKEHYTSICFTFFHFNLDFSLFFFWVKFFFWLFVPIYLWPTDICVHECTETVSVCVSVSTVHYMHVRLWCRFLCMLHRLRSRKVAQLHPPPEKLGIQARGWLQPPKPHPCAHMWVGAKTFAQLEHIRTRRLAHIELYSHTGTRMLPNTNARSLSSH